MFFSSSVKDSRSNTQWERMNKSNKKFYKFTNDYENKNQKNVI